MITGFRTINQSDFYLTRYRTMTQSLYKQDYYLWLENYQFSELNLGSLIDE
jgi:hypothetical protein